MSYNLSYWEKKNFFSADIIIVGSGIVGLNAAIKIKEEQPKLNLIILERGFLPSGASTKNAGFACFGSISELIEQEKIAGTNGLHDLISKRWKGLLKLRKLLGDDIISYKNYGGFELFKANDRHLSEECVSKISHYNLLIKDIVQQNDVFSINNAKIKSFGLANINTLIENNLEAQIDPGKMMGALLQKASLLGIQIFNNCTLKGIIPAEKEVILNTNQGDFIAKKVLLTTNAFISEFFPDLDIVPGRGQVVVTSPIKDLKFKGTFHYDKGYYYFRNIDQRILLGGGRNLDFNTEATTNFGTTGVIENALIKLLKEVIIPTADFKIEYKWSGIMAFGTQLFPVIQEIKTHVYCAVRCNGMGIAIGTQTGHEAADMILQSI